MDPLVGRERPFAIAAHRAIGQKRKHTGECYATHLTEVIGLFARHGGSDAMIASLGCTT